MYSDSIVQDKNVAFGYIHLVANVEKEPEQVIFEAFD